MTEWKDMPVEEQAKDLYTTGAGKDGRSWEDLPESTREWWRRSITTSIHQWQLYPDRPDRFSD